MLTGSGRLDFSQVVAWFGHSPIVPARFGRECSIPPSTKVTDYRAGGCALTCNRYGAVTDEGVKRVLPLSCHRQPRPHRDHMRTRNTSKRPAAIHTKKPAITGYLARTGGNRRFALRVHTAEVTGSNPVAPTEAFRAPCLPG